MNKNIWILALSLFVQPAFGQQATSCSDQVLQMFMVNATQTPAPGVGGILLFSEDFAKAPTPQDVAQVINRLKKDREPAPFIAIDQEGGKVQRLDKSHGFTTIPSHAAIGKAGSVSIAKRFSQLTTEELMAVGVNWNFGTVLDVNTNPNNPIIGKLGRSFSSDPNVVTEFGESFLEGSLASGVIPTVKHFPGHGSTTSDTHLGFAAVNETWEQLNAIDLVPFRAAVAKFNEDMAVMIAHISLPKILGPSAPPASLSKSIVTDLLRNQMNFKGLIVTDDLHMGAIANYYTPLQAAKAAILAGNDILILSGVTPSQQISIAQTICNDAQTNANLSARIEDSYQRILDVKRRFHVSNALSNITNATFMSAAEEQEAESVQHDFNALSHATASE